MGMASPHCVAFVNPKCAKHAKQKKRVRIACVLNGKQNSAAYGAVAHTSGETTCSKGDRIRQLQTVWGGPLVLP